MKSPDLSPASRERATDFREESRGRLGLRPARRARWCPPFVLGLNTQIAQLLILREAMILSSGSETALGLCLGAWALLNGVGALGGWAISRSGVRLERFFLPLLVILPLLMAGSVHLARLSRSFIDLPAAEHLPVTLFVALAFLVVGPVTLVDGFLFVGGLHYLFARRRSARDASFMYGVESLGSLAGGMVFSFVLVDLLDPFSIAGLLLCVNAIGLLQVVGVRDRSRATIAGIILSLAAGTAALFLGPGLNADSERARWRVLQPDMELLATRDSRYQNLAVLAYGEEPTLFSNGSVLFGLRPRLEGDHWDWNRSVFPHFAMLQHSAPRKVLLLGGVSKGYAADILLHGPDHVDLVESDRELLALTEPYLSDGEKRALKSESVEVHLLDGRHFVIMAAEASYDVILLDMPDPSNASTNRYYTEEFFASCRRALAPGGVLVFSLSNQTGVIGKEMMERNGSILKAVNRVFADYLITPGETSFVAASSTAGSLNASADALLARYESRSIDTPRFSPYIFFTWFDENDVDWVSETYSTELAKGRIEPKTDNRPVAYLKDYLLWRRITESGRSSNGDSPNGDSPHGDSPHGDSPHGGRKLEEWLSGTGRSAPPLVLLPALFPGAGVVFFALYLLSRRGSAVGRRSSRALHYTTAAAVGFNGIVLELAVLLFYQGVAGHLYSRMGIIIASYMAGLVAGSLFPGERRFVGAPFVFSCVCTFAGIAGVFGLIALSTNGAAFLGGELTGLAGFGFVTALLGASGGLAFRGTAVALERSGRSPGGIIYALDILGTCLGGVLAGSVLAPFIGISGAMILAGGMNVILPLLSFSALCLKDKEG